MTPQAKPEYRPSNPKIDLSIRANDGSEKYIFSTNYWRTCRDALAWYRANMPEFEFVRAVRDNKGN